MVCPFEVSLDLLGEVDLVVCDYNYVFDPTIGLRALVHGNALRDSVLIIDEAHNLVDRSREYFSPELKIENLNKALAFLNTKIEPGFRRAPGSDRSFDRRGPSASRREPRRRASQ